MRGCRDVSSIRAAMTSRDLDSRSGRRLERPRFLTNPNCLSPYLRPEFTQAVAAVRDDIEVAVAERNDEPVAFLPFRRMPWGGGRPAGGWLANFQAIVARPISNSTVAGLRRRRTSAPGNSISCCCPPRASSRLCGDPGNLPTPTCRTDSKDTAAVCESAAIASPNYNGSSGRWRAIWERCASSITSATAKSCRRSSSGRRPNTRAPASEISSPRVGVRAIGPAARLSKRRPLLAALGPVRRRSHRRGRLHAAVRAEFARLVHLLRPRTVYLLARHAVADGTVSFGRIVGNRRVDLGKGPESYKRRCASADATQVHEGTIDASVLGVEYSPELVAYQGLGSLLASAIRPVLRQAASAACRAGWKWAEPARRSRALFGVPPQGPNSAGPIVRPVSVESRRA